MKYQIKLDALWRHGRAHYHAGVYRVPEDLSEDVAQAAMRAEAAVKVSPKAGAPENKLASVPEGGSDPSAAPGRQSRGSGQEKPSRSSQADPRSQQGKPKRSGEKPASS